MGGFMKDRKMSWVKPELVILVRNKPEETVLTACKRSGSNNPDGAVDGGCKGFDPVECSPCNVVSDS
jgi:hypothetical protein